MLIKKEVYKKIIDYPREIPPEFGGALGGNDGIISFMLFDEGQNNGKGCSYSPNVDVVNMQIEQWLNAGIDFMGLYHSHFFGVDTLSKGDIEYIGKIMNSVFEYINELYFPIVVMPERKLIAYKAIWTQGVVNIKKDVAKIVY